MKIGSTKRKQCFDECMLLVIIFITNLSQLPYFVDNGFTQYVTYISWGGLFCYVLLKKKLMVNRKIMLMAVLSVILILCLMVQSLCTGNSYFGTRIFYCFFISMFIFCVSSLLPEEAVNLENISGIFRAYFYSGVLLSIVIYMEYFRSGFDIFSPIYTYGSKNSTSQIILTAIIVAFFFKTKTKKESLIKNLAILFLIFLLLIMKSRASIIGIAVLYIGIMWGRTFSSKFKMMLTGIIIVSILVVLRNPNIYNIVVNGILLAGRDATNINEISSGRVGEWGTAIQLIKDNLFMGVGKRKVECFPLSVLVQYGIISGGIIIYTAIYPIYYGMRKAAKNPYAYCLVIIASAYLLNGLFEELSPFGPGVKCYFLWFLFGVLSQPRMRKEQTNRLSAKRLEG